MVRNILKSQHLLPTLVTAATFVVSACTSGDQPTSDVQFESAHSKAVDATIEEGEIITDTSNAFLIKQQIREQLMYSIGQLNGVNGGVDMNRLKVTTGDVTPREDGRFEVKYSAELFVSWERTREIPESFTFIVPASGTPSGLDSFFEAFGSDEDTTKECLAREAHDVSRGIFWYYYRPEKSSCPLKEQSDSDPEMVRYLKAGMVFSSENTEGKYPEYEKIWEDGRLVVTSIYGKNEYGATSDFDAGIAAYRRTYNVILNNLGQPATSNLEEGQQPSAVNDVIEMTFEVEHGILDIHLYLVDDIKLVDEEFRLRYNARTHDSDYVAYNGHAGLGANIRALARMGEFQPGQWQLFLINGCDTFAYVDDSLRNAHQAVNPDFGHDKFVDVITNAMPAFFSSLARDNWAVIEGLLGKAATYREILAGFDSYQRAAVTGEQDNAWPAPFIAE